MIVAEAPGQMEDERGVQLVGRSGQWLRKVLRELKVDLDADCWKTNSVICHQPGNKTPTDRQIEACRPNLFRAVEELEPETIILLGAAAVKSLIGRVWRSNVGPIGRWVGWRVPSQELNAWICSTWHPAYLLREKDRVLDLWFRRYLKAAFALRGRPWQEGLPEYERRVEPVYEPSRAAAGLRRMVELGGEVTFDYETDRLKPDHPDARIVSCAVCWRGERTIAYPWQGEAVEATGELLRSEVGKIGWNIKYEQRWSRAKLRMGVCNWVWDGMQASHVLDNRPGITSLKFQSFVQLGQGSYDGGVAPYFKSGSSNEPNRIHEISLGELLKYNGLDALLTYKIAEIQRKEMGL